MLLLPLLPLFARHLADERGHTSPAISCHRGPTAVVPDTHLFGIDRHGFPHSEERVDLHMVPPKTRQQWQDALLSWNGHALSIFGHLGVDPALGDLTVPEREHRIRAGYSTLFGDPTLREHKLTVSAGSVVIKVRQRSFRRLPFHCLSWSFSVFPCDSTVLTNDRCP